MFKRILIAAGLLLAASAPAFPQAGQFPSGYVQSNATASAGQGKPNAVTAILDRALGSTRGAILERGSSGWGIVGPGTTAGLAWISGGTGVDPSYAALGISGGGTGCTSASGTCLDNITGFSSTTGYLTRTGPGAYTFSFPAFSQVTGSAACSQLPAMTGVVTTTAGSCAHVYPNANANTVLSNWTGSPAAPIFNVWPACANDGAHALVYVNGTGLVCGVLTTGGTVTSMTPGAGLVSSITAACSQTAITITGTFSKAECVNAQTGTSYAILDTDRAKLITASNAAAQAYSIAQAGAASAFQAGWHADIQNNSAVCGAGVVTLTPTTSTINGASTLKLLPGQSARIVSDGTNYQAVFTPAPGGMVLLNCLTASNSATLSDTTSFTGAYSFYEIVLQNIIPATNNGTLNLQVHSGGSFQAATYVSSIILNSSTYSQSQATGSIGLSNAGVLNSSPGLSGVIRLTGFNVASTPKWFTGQTSYLGSSTLAYLVGVTGIWNSTSAIDGIQILFASGNITSGVIKIYGYP